MVRRPQNPVPQIIRRVHEQRSAHSVSRKDAGHSFKQPHFSGPLPSPSNDEVCQQYRQYNDSRFFVSCAEGDNCFQVSGKVILVKNILVFPSETKLVVQEFEKQEPFFDFPLNSTQLGIVLVSEPSKRKLVGTPLLHTS